jgi:hypothetical protein
MNRKTESRETLETIRGIQRGLEALKAGQGQPAKKVLERIRVKYKIPRAPR